MNTKELLERYDIGRSAFMNRLANLDKQHGFKLDKDSQGRNNANNEQLAVLDELDEHLKAGRRLEDFVMRSPVTVAQDSVRQASDSKPQVSNNGHLAPSDSYLSDSVQPVLDIAILAEAIAHRIDPLANHRHLIWAANEQLLLTTKEVQQLIGTKPHGEIFDRGSFRFIRSGKIGNQSAWRVERI